MPQIRFGSGAQLRVAHYRIQCGNKQHSEQTNQQKKRAAAYEEALASAVQIHITAAHTQYQKCACVERCVRTDINSVHSERSRCATVAPTQTSLTFTYNSIIQPFIYTRARRFRGIPLGSSPQSFVYSPHKSAIIWFMAFFARTPHACGRIGRCTLRPDRTPHGFARLIR